MDRRPPKPVPRPANPRVLVVTPEITYLPSGMGNMTNVLRAKAGGLADVSAALVSALFELGADVHVALPHYRRMFNIDVGRLINDELRLFKSKLPDARIHLAEDRVFYYRDEVYGRGSGDNTVIALAFQREVINNIVPNVKPDLIHCNDWMTGLIPAMARRMNIPCLFTVHNIHTEKATLAAIEDRGIDAAEFWRYLYFSRPPYNYEESRSSNLVDMLASGIFASHFINTVSPTFLEEVVDGRHAFIPGNIRAEVASKKRAGCAFGILNAPDPTLDPATDRFLASRYTAENHAQAKRENKLALQARVGLKRSASAPMFFWPSRLDPVQKGCQLLTSILYPIVSRYWKENLQVVVVASGPYQRHFHDIVHHHDFFDRVAVCDFEEGLSHLGFAASDFMLMPSQFEPCGLPQMSSAIYGSLPVVHDTGGLHDTVSHIDLEQNTGNGFVFRDFNANGLMWAMDQAMSFYKLPAAKRASQTARIMTESAARFNHAATAKAYIDLYERMLQRPLVPPF
ncbi:MAG: glycogen synthase [Lentisphaerae bacterium RIFOXYB12_FULL_65_16]|nr:MAG: glycogen synthase [Lentisphaerae bacterium RIFOXYA12_64_32]OGV91008.1 MAG: glycogen synthase [Lentisphaerae bacterium RIFOXYB12_FULL_65_16]